MLQDGLDAGREGSLFALAAVSKVGVTGKAGKVGAELEDYLWSLEDPPGLVCFSNVFDRPHDSNELQIKLHGVGFN